MMQIEAERPQYGLRLSVIHDPAARRITGPDAEAVLAMIASWRGEATLYGTQVVPAPDPLGSTPDLLAMLATWNWELPPDAAALLPPAEAVPDGAVA